MKKKLNGHHIFDGRTVVIATMHEKEKVIAPILEKELSVKCKTISNLNTDKFGTFSGEVERKDSPLQTVKSKALAALDLCNETLAVASEGSFGPHPSSIFIPANEEFIFLIDTKYHLEIVGRFFTLTTNFNHRVITSMKALDVFKTDIGYPEHDIILKIVDSNHVKHIYKDFDSTKALEAKVQEALQRGQTIKAETDMRAMNNPTRMHSIENAVINLIKNIKSHCPECNAPGFAIQEAILGLPCELCNRPTKSAKAYRYHCQNCDYSFKRDNEGLYFEDAMYCDFCNP